MRLEITIDDTVLKDLFLPIGNDKVRMNRVVRINRYTLVVSEELLAEWEKGMKQYKLIELYNDWLVNAISSRENFRKVKLSDHTKVEGSSWLKDQAVLSTSYESASKIVVGDYSFDLRRSNRQLRFVDIKSFSSDKRDTITMQMIEQTLSDTDTIKKYLFDIYETPVILAINNHSSARLLAIYLSQFYDDKIVIQDLYFIQNEHNFKSYILPYINRDRCNITVIISTSDGAQHKKRIQREYKDYRITVKCEPKEKDDLH